MCWHVDGPLEWLNVALCGYAEASASAQIALMVAGVSLVAVAAVGVAVGWQSRRGATAKLHATASGAQFGLAVLATVAIAYAGAWPLAALAAVVAGIAGYTRFALVPRMPTAPGAARTAALLAWVGAGLAAAVALVGA